MPAPTNSKVITVAHIVAATFVGSDAEAKECAESLVDLAEGWGAGAPVAGWDDAVQNYFGGRLRWRSDKEKERFLQSKRSTATAYERYIQDRK